MKISTKSNFSVFELIIESDRVAIKEDVAGFNREIPQELIDNLISAALEMSRYSGKQDSQFVQHILEKFTQDGTLDELI